MGDTAGEAILIIFQKGGQRIQGVPSGMVKGPVRSLKKVRCSHTGYKVVGAVT